MILFFLYAFKRLRKQSWNEVVGLGLGFGAFEVLLLGISAFIITLLAILMPEQLPERSMAFSTRYPSDNLHPLWRGFLRFLFISSPQS
jgi:dipeptide/tripeptide permease